jgi:RNA polymerase I-specific transcription initiation factor RRN3
MASQNSAVSPLPPTLKKVRIDTSEEIIVSGNMFKSYIQNALDQLDNHNPGPLNSLASRLALPSTSQDALTTQQLMFMLSALTSEVSRLDSQACDPISESILKLQWVQRGPDFEALFVRFLGVLISGIPKWWSRVANKVIAEFTQLKTDSHHSVLRHILRLIPTSSSAFQSIFIKHFPHKSSKVKPTVAYIKNLLVCSEYVRELERGVWSLIFERLVELDVELYEDFDDDNEDENDEEDEEDDDEDEDDELENQDGIKAEESNGDNDDEDEFDGSDEEITQHELGDDATQEMQLITRKLDIILSILFEYLDERINPQTLENGDGISLFTILLEEFKAFVLPTHRTRSIQYLIFRVCHSHPDLLDAFLASMTELALSPTEHVERRQKAMQYISSFVARAKGLTKTQIVFVVSILTAWLDRYITEREVEVDYAMGGMGRFKMFFSVSQTLFYIFCFRHQMLEKEGGWECDLDKLFQRLIITKFNPLRYCKRTVVAMFARIAQKKDAAYCFTIMEQNRLGGFRSSASTTPSTTPYSSMTSSYFGPTSTFWAKNQEFAALEGYFPFDPLVLKRAGKYIRDYYVEWDDISEEFEDSGSEDYEEEDNDNSDQEVEMPDEIDDRKNLTDVGDDDE